MSTVPVAQPMLLIRCRCGQTLRTPRSAVGSAGRCPFCESMLRLVAPGYKSRRDNFRYGLVITEGPVRVGEQMLLGGPGPIEVGKIARYGIFLPGRQVS